MDGCLVKCRGPALRDAARGLGAFAVARLVQLRQTVYTGDMIDQEGCGAV